MNHTVLSCVEFSLTQSCAMKQLNRETTLYHVEIFKCRRIAGYVLIFKTSPKR